jgi:uncharacterized membrane protein
MAALAYLLPPLSGLIAYLFTSDARVRFHGLQAIVFGAAWPLAVYIGSFFSPVLTRAAFGLGALVWVALLVSTAFGSDLGLPGLGERLRSVVSYERTS